MPGDLYEAAGSQWNIDPLLLRAVEYVESRGRTDATSKAGAEGNMQFMPATARSVGVSDPRQPAFSVPGAAKHLHSLLDDAKGDPVLALKMYAGGPDQSKWGQATNAYPQLVANAYQMLKRSAGNQPVVQAQFNPATMSDADLDKALRGNGETAPEQPAKPDIATMSDEHLDKMLSGKPPEPPKPNEPTLSDVLSSPEAQAADVPQSQTPNPALGRIAQSATQAYKDTPSILTPKAQAAVDQGGPVGRWLVNPALRAIGGAAAAGNALAAGGAQAVNETANALGVPALGRDVNMLSQVAPVAGMGAGVPTGPRGVQEAPPSPRFVQEYYGEGTRENPLAANPTPAAPAFAPPGTNLPPEQPKYSLGPPEPPAFIPPRSAGNPLAPQGGQLLPPGGEPVPRSAGAASSREQTPSTLVDMTPAEVQAYRSTAEGQKLIEPQQPGVADPTIYVPNVTPNAAEIEQSVNTARELKSLNMQAPEVSQEAKEIAASNNEARQQYFAKVAGSDVDVMNAKAARQAQAEKDLAATWANKTEADAKPVLDVAAEIKASPDGRRPIVRNAVDAVTKELLDADGNLITDPEQLYGVRKHIDDLMSKEAGVDDPKAVRAFANLGALKTALDGVIEEAAPGFREYLRNFADASKRIDEMEVLQKHENKLYDAQNRMTYNKVQTMMRNIVDSRQAQGVNPYKSISDDTMQRLWALRDDLRRSASAQELARTPGSDTTQNMIDALKGIGRTGANLAVHGAILSHVGPVGNVLYNGVRNVLSAGAEARAARQRAARGMSLLHPNVEQRNPLQGP